MFQSLRSAFLLLLAFAASDTAIAQSTSSVSGPEIRANEASAEYRLGVTDPTIDESYIFAHRFSYDKAITGRFRLRGMIQFSDHATSDLEYSYFEADALWQIKERTPSGFASALRLDYRIRDGNGPEQIGLNWINEWRLEDGWRVRWMGLADREFGDAASDGFFLESRSSLSKSLSNHRIGLSSYNHFGNTDSGFGSFRDQRHQIGPTLESEFAAGLKWTVGALAGLSEDAPDAVIQFRLEKDLSLAE